MTELSATPAEALARARRIDGVCDEFEAAWLAGQTPEIQDFLARAPDEDRAVLALELLPLDTHHRRRRVGREELLVSLGEQTESAGIGSSGASTQREERLSETILSIGACEVLHEIARGGMGIVFKGRDTDLRRDVAVKVLLDRHQGEAELIRRFIEEAQISGQLQHPGITPIYELGEFPDGRPYFTMKLVKGETLAQLLAARPDPRADRERFLKIFEQICQTLAYAHSRGVIHRDLKPSNIMVGAFGEVQVMDWGLAKVLAEGGASPGPSPDVSVIRTARSDGLSDSTGSSSQTQFGSVLGTLAYMPPEQALGEIDQLDQRADVFGLGAILCEILTSRPPYVAANFEQLRRKAVRGELGEAFECLAQCGADEELTRLARRALSPEPADRPADAGVLAAELVAYREGVETRLRQAELAEAQAVTRAAAERSRRKLTLAFAGALLAVFAIGIIGTTWGMVRAGRAKESLRRDLYVADMQLANQTWESDNGSAKNVASLLAGHLPVAGQSDLREFAWRLQWTELNRNSLVLKGHARAARLVAYLPNQQLATLDADLVLRRWRLPNGTKLSETSLQGISNATCWAISAQGKLLAVGADDGVNLFDVLTGNKLHTFPGNVRVEGLSFSANGRRLATAWSDGRVQVWETATGKSSATLILRQPKQISELERIELASDGESFYLLGYPKHDEIALVTIKGAELLCPTEHRSSIFSIALTPDGKWRATGDSNGKVCLSENSPLDDSAPPLRPHRGIVSALAFSADGTRLATGGADGMVTIWDVAGRKQLYTFKGHLGRIRSVSFAPDGQTVASASDDGTTHVWNLRQHLSSQVLGVTAQPVFCVAYSPNGRHLAVGVGSGSVTPGGYLEVWDIASGKLVTEFWAADGRVLALAYSPDGSRLYSGGYDGVLRVWDTETWRDATPTQAAAPVEDVLQSALGTLAVSPDGRFVAGGFGHPTYHQDETYDQAARVWDASSGTLLATLPGHENTICDVAFSRDGTLLATAGDDQQIKLWSTRNWRPFRTLAGTERNKSVAFSADGKWLATGGASGDVTIWNTADGRVVNRLRGHADAVYRLAFSPDGRTLATASWDNTVKLWDPVSGRETRTLHDHEEWVSCLAFSPDGNTLATGSFDATVRLWEAATLQEITGE